MKLFLRLVPWCALGLPFIVSASDTTQNVIQIASLFNIMVGFMLVASFLLYGSGMVTWALRLGTFPTFRDEAIHTLELAVGTLFVLVVLLGIAEFVQTHVSIALYIIAGVIMVALAWFILATGAFTEGGSEEEKHE